MLFQDKIYVALKVDDNDNPIQPQSRLFNTPYSHSEKMPMKSMLCCSSGKLDKSWKSLPNVDAVSFGLGTYQSKLVRVGGLQSLDEETFKPSVLSSVLVSDDGITWRDSLPPLPTRRACPMVVTVGRNPEYLVVAGGCDYSPVWTCLPTVEVLAEGQWYTLQSFPVPCVVRNHCIHNGKFFMTLDLTMGSGFTRYCSVLFCEVETLLAQCTECVAGKEPRSLFWEIEKACDVGFSTKFIDEGFDDGNFPIFSASLGGYLITMK